MQMTLKVQQVTSLSKGMVRLQLVRQGLKARIQPIPQNEEQKVVQDMVSRVSQAFEDNFPGGIVIGGPNPLSRKWDGVIDMQITEEEYQQLGKPSIGDMINIDINRASEDEQPPI